ncbi:50S ribosomal protein L25 [Candidatus Falkowbacteria bacterium CG_4_9_14_3_um_filter_38_19]|uniref:Large ribosomal subunit protein bL25 n=1 Tax=Candidatus Falkowbacteria bacterium CG_4_9_14_3_um_filter_38_19 TaxID=1974559 RepID=A0A2M8AIV9_9BACT|nr:50S ribosomal protein L25 [Candidatus Falkowbacteria bacterium]PJB17395.1 MAG: 50S ribosomal protein L25 [Candidatus Falkowbacteria bacterium CG_4_9_14_3_um_filter_38_19]
MTKKIKLNAQTKSEPNGRAKKIRNSGYIPAVVYGSGITNTAIKIKRHDFEQAFALAGESNLIDLSIDDKEPVKVIIKEVAKDNIKDNIIHVDFYRVDMSKKITTEIPLSFINESLAIKELGGTLIKNIDSLEITCLPSDLVDHIDVNLGQLQNFGDLIRIEDVKLPAGMALVSRTNEVIVSVTEATKEEELVKPAAAPSEEAAGKTEEPAAAETESDKDKEK